MPNQIERNKYLIMLVTSLLGIGLSYYLWHLQIESVVNPCSLEGGCSYVLKSDYGKILEVPIAVFGFFYYVALSSLLLLKTRIKDILLESVFVVTLVSGIAFTVYLRYLEFVKIGEICKYCWGSVVIILVITALYTVSRDQSRDDLLYWIRSALMQ